MANYTIIYGNVIYKVNDVDYISTSTHRIFKRDSDVVLSIPLSSILIRDGQGVKAQIVNGLNNGAGIPIPNDTTVIQQSEDNFVEGMVVGGIIGSIIF